MTLLIIAILLQLLDGYTTHVVLSRGGVEKNPIMADLMEKVGLVPAILIAKAIGIGVVYYLYSEGANLFLLLVVLMYSYVVYKNYQAMKR